jgi:membrane associated rhomboid family serine protease
MDLDGKNGEHKKGHIVPFPSQAEREKIKSEKIKEKQKINPAMAGPDGAAAAPFLNLQNIPPFTAVLISALVLIHAGLSFFADEALRLVVSYEFGFIPGTYTGAYEWQWSALAAPLSHAFIHGSWMHLLFNAVMGLSLGIFFERIYGTRRTALFFIICTLAGALTYLAFSPFTTTPMIGASGGISGYFGACLLLMIQQRQNISGKTKSPWPVLFFWGIFMSVPAILMGEAVAWQAHLGGYVCGLALLVGMQRGYIKL